MAEHDVEDRTAFSSQGGGGTTSNISETITRIIPGGPWFLETFEAAGNSRLGRFVRWHRERLVRVGGAALYAALGTGTLGHLGLLPPGQPNAWSPAIAGAIAVLLAMSTRLSFGLWDLIRLAKSAVTEMLVMIGAGAVAAVLFWDRLGPARPWTLNEAMAHLRASAPAIGSTMVGLWIVWAFMRAAFSGFGFRSSYSTYRAAAFDHEMAARHEASHALVATVLGIAVDAAWIVRIPDKGGVGGAVGITAPVSVSTAEALYSLLARKVAINVAGVAGARGSWSMDAILEELRGQRDWTQAGEASWIASSIHPDRNLLSDVLAAIVPELRAKPWQDAIEEAAQLLLRAKGASVPPEAFTATVRRFGLTLPTIEEIAGGFP